MKKKIWISPTDFVEFKEDISLRKQIASRDRSLDFYAIGQYLPDPDPVLKNMGKDLSTYRSLLVDPHVWACAQSRKSGALSLEWGIDRGKAKSRQARLIEDLFEDLDLYRIMGEILDAVLWGFQPIEILWGKTGSYVLPLDILGKPPEWFVFHETTNELLFKTRSNPLGEQLPPKKFLVPQYCASYNNPYGERVLSRVFWPVTFKKGALKFWVVFTEKYGMPFAVGKHPRGAKETEIDNLADMLEDMVQDAIAVIPDDSSVELMDFGGRTSSSEIYHDLIAACNAEISKAILGQTLSTELGEGGSYAATRGHLDVRQDIIDQDIKMIEETMNLLIKWIFDLNFGAGNMPTFSMWQEEEVDKMLAERDQILSNIGVKFTKEYFNANYGLDDKDFEIGEPEPEIPPQVPGPGPIAPNPEEDEENEPIVEMAESGLAGLQNRIDRVSDRLSDMVLQKQMETVLKPVLEMILAGNNFADVKTRLTAIYPKMASEQIENLLARMMFVAETIGRLEVKNEEVTK